MAKKRKSLYETNVLPKFDQIKEWRSAGQTEANIAKLLGVSYASFQVYKKQHEEFQELLSESKKILIEQLERTMFECALGKIKVRETKKFIQQNGDKEQVRVEETVKELPPNPTLLIFSLKNLCSEKWGEHVDINANISGAMDNMNQVFAELKNKLNTINTEEIKDVAEKDDVE